MCVRTFSSERGRAVSLLRASGLLGIRSELDLEGKGAHRPLEAQFGSPNTGTNSASGARACGWPPALS